MDIRQEDSFYNDELKIYRGEDFKVSKHIILHQPTLGEICDWGESKYYAMIYNFVSTPQSLKGQLWNMGIDYTTIKSPYDLFCILFIKGKLLPLDSTKIIFGNLDFTKFTFKKWIETNEIVLYQKINNDDVIFDEHTYNIVIDYLCKVHFIIRDLKNPLNETTKMILIEDALDELSRVNENKKQSQLKNLISAMINSEGFKYNHSQVWDMKINAFMDSVKRIVKIKNAELLLQSGYSGFGVNLKEINNKQLDWLGELNES